MISDGANGTDGAHDDGFDGYGDAGGSAGVAGAELFPGDTGTLPAAVRNTLVRVMTSRFIDGVRHPDLWNAVLTHESPLTSRLHDLYVELIIDRARRPAALLYLCAVRGMAAVTRCNRGLAGAPGGG